MIADRREFLRTSGKMIAGLTTISTIATEVAYSQTEEANSSSSDWPMFCRDVINRGWNQQTTGPEKLFLHNAFPAVREIRAAPTVRDGLVCFSNLGGRLYATDIHGDEELWHFDTGSTIHSSAAITADAVYFGSFDHDMYKIDITNGIEKGEERDEEWSFSTDGGISSSPTVSGNFVYFGSNDGNIYSVHKETKVENWSFSTDAPIISTPAVTSDTVYIGNNDGNIYAIDIESGDEVGRFETGGAIGSSPVVVDGIVYIGSNDNFIYVLSTDLNNDEIWKYDFEHPVKASPAVAHGNVYIGGREGGLYAFDAINGDIVWEPFEQYEGFSSPAATKERVYVGSEDGYVYALTKETGTPEDRFETGKRIRSSPAVVDNRVYIGSYDENLYVLGEEDGTDDGNGTDDGATPGKDALLFPLSFITILFGSFGFIIGNIKDEEIRSSVLQPTFEGVITIALVVVLSFFGAYATAEGWRFGLNLSEGNLFWVPISLVFIIIALLAGVVIGDRLRKRGIRLLTSSKKYSIFYNVEYSRYRSRDPSTLPPT